MVLLLSLAPFTLSATNTVPLLHSSRKDAFQKPQISLVGEVLKGQNSTPSYTGGPCLQVDLSPSSLPTLPPLWKATAPHCPLQFFSTVFLPPPLDECCKASSLIPVDRPSAGSQMEGWGEESC